MSKNNSTIDDIIDFLENEKSLYGAFTPPELQIEPDAAESESEINKIQKTEPGKVKAEEAQEPETTYQPKLSLNERLDQCKTLDELRQLCENAEELKTDLENTNLVFGVGNPKADLMIIGEAPGQEEDKQGEPFVGAAGRLLNKILKAINFDRDDVYIANILKHRPPGNRNPSGEERRRSLPYLLRQIDLINPKIILCVGKVSGTTLLNRDDTLRNMRGSFHNFREAKLTVTYHPAALLRNPQWKRPAWEDVQMVRKKYDELTGS